MTLETSNRSKVPQDNKIFRPNAHVFLQGPEQTFLNGFINCRSLITAQAYVEGHRTASSSGTNELGREARVDSG